MNLPQAQAPQLPAYLQNRAAPKLNETAVIGLGGILPPHISIQGNTFTLIDGAGMEQPHGPILDCCVADMQPFNCKRFYGAKWEPDSNSPPDCWSANGVAPSRDAVTPQSPTCDTCPKNVRGSAVSQISGAAIKACRDEKWLALVIPQYPAMAFQLVLTPGSFKNWQAYIERCRGSQTDLSDVLTRVMFEPKVNGVLQFQPISYIDEATHRAREAGHAEKKFDALVGRNDVPRTAGLPAPNAALALAAPAQTAATGQLPVSVGQSAAFVPNAAPPAASPAFGAQQGGFQPQAPAAPFGAQPAATTPNAAASPAASPSEPPKQRRARRTAAQIAADAAQDQQPTFGQAPAAAAPAQAPAGFGQQAPAPAAAPQAPFLAAQPPAQPGAQFGIAPGVSPNPELTQAIAGLFGPQG